MLLVNLGSEPARRGAAIASRSSSSRRSRASRGGEVETLDATSERGAGGFGEHRTERDDRALHASRDGPRLDRGGAGSALARDRARAGRGARRARRGPRGTRASSAPAPRVDVRAHAGDRGRGEARRHRLRVLGRRDASATRGASSTSGSPRRDVVDTAFALQLRDAADLLLAGLDGCAAPSARRRSRHKRHADDRPHARHPRRADHLRAQVRELVRRARARPASGSRAARDEIAFGKLSGAVGTFANNAPDGRGRGAARGSGSRRSRSRRRSCRATATRPSSRRSPSWPATLERIALEIRHLQRTEVGEAPSRSARARRARRRCRTSATRS